MSKKQGFCQRVQTSIPQAKKARCAVGPASTAKAQQGAMYLRMHQLSVIKVLGPSTEASLLWKACCDPELVQLVFNAQPHRPSAEGTVKGVGDVQDHLQRPRHSKEPRPSEVHVHNMAFSLLHQPKTYCLNIMKAFSMQVVCFSLCQLAGCPNQHSAHLHGKLMMAYCTVMFRRSRVLDTAQG